MTTEGWHETRWWRAVGPDGVWCESSDETEVREMARPDDRIQVLMERTESRWEDRPATPEVPSEEAPLREEIGEFTNWNHPTIYQARVETRTHWVIGPTRADREEAERDLVRLRRHRDV